VTGIKHPPYNISQFFSFHEIGLSLTIGANWALRALREPQCPYQCPYQCPLQCLPQCLLRCSGFGMRERLRFAIAVISLPKKSFKKPFHLTSVILIGVVALSIAVAVVVPIAIAVAVPIIVAITIAVALGLFKIVK